MSPAERSRAATGPARVPGLVAAGERSFSFEFFPPKTPEGERHLWQAIRELVESITTQVTAALMRRNPAGGTFHIEDIQDQVELSLMRSGEHEVARAYVLYREKRNQERAAHPEEMKIIRQPRRERLDHVQRGGGRPSQYVWRGVCGFSGWDSCGPACEYRGS